MDSVADLLSSSGLPAPASSGGGGSAVGGVSSLLAGAGLTAPSSTGSISSAIASLPSPQQASYKDVPGLDLTQTSVPNQMPAQLTSEYGTSSTISQAPAQGFWGKVGSFFGKVGDLLNGETNDSSIQEQNARNAIVQSTTASVNNQPYLAIAKQLGIDQAVTPVLPKGVDPTKITPNVMQYYKDQAAANVVKNNFATLQKQFPDLEDPSKDAVTPDQVSQQMGVDPESLLGKTEAITGILGAAALAIGTGGVADILTAMTGEGTAETGALPMLTTLAKNVGIFTALDKITTPLRNLIVQKGNVGDGGQALLYVAQQAANIFGTGLADAGLDKLADLFAKNTVTSYVLPQTFTISGEDLRNITGTSKMTPDEVDQMGKDLGWTQEQTNALKNGATVTTPSYKVITTADKPWWGKVKSIFGFEPTNDVTATKSGGSMSGLGGEIGVGPEPITPEGLQALATKVSGGSDETGLTNPAPENPLTPALTEIANKVTAASKATKGVDSLLKASGVQLSSSSPENPDTSYQGSNSGSLRRANDSGPKASDITDVLLENSKNQFSPDDIKILKSVQGNPDAEITVYRGTPGKSINPGDWVTLNRASAERYTKTKLGTPISGTQVHELKIPAKELIAQISAGKNRIYDLAYFPKGTSENSLQVDKNGKPIENKNNGNNSKIANKTIRTGLGQNSQGGRSNEGTSEKRVGNGRDVQVQEGPLSRYYRENGGGDQNGPEDAQAKSIIAGKLTAIDGDTPIVLKSLGFSSPFIGNLTLVFEKGGIKNIWIYPIEGKPGEDSVGGYVDDIDTLVINSDSLDHSSIADGSVINHELSGHSWFYKLSPEGRLAFYTELKGNTDLVKNAWENTPDANHSYYWERTINQIGLEVQNHLSPEESRQVMDSVGLHSDPTISLDSFIERSLRLDDTIKAINENLKGRGIPAITLKAEDTWAIGEYVGVMAENAPKLPSDDTSMIGRYIGDIQDGTLTYGEDGAQALAYPGETDLTLKTLEKLKGRTTVSKQYISDLSNASDLKQPERDILRTALDQYLDGAQIPVQQFADTVKTDLLPLNVNDEYKPSIYESVALPANQRGKVSDYHERIYESPIKTSAGATHFSNQGVFENYFGHTRVEDVADTDTRRVIEVQSDLFQKGNFGNEFPIGPYGRNEQIKYWEDLIKKGGDELSTIEDAREQLEGIKGGKKLEQYSNPSAHFRMVREEIKQAAKDGKTALQFPIGETAMKIEGLGRSDAFVDEKTDAPIKIQDLKIGKEIRGNYEGNDNTFVIVNVLEDGKFTALPKKQYEFMQSAFKQGLQSDARAYERNAETFDISGKVDTNNPIYRFYEKDLARYLKNNYGAKPVTDAQGVTWNEVPIKASQAKEPVTAFRIKATDLNQLRSMLDREQQSLDAAISNPEAHQMAYGNNPEKSIPKYKARIAEIKAQIENVKNPKFDTGDALSDARAALASVQARVGVPETNIGKMTKDLDTDKANLEFYDKNPKAIELAGKEAPKALETKIAKAETKIKAAKKTLLDTVKKIPVSKDAPRGLEYPADIQQRAIALAQEREEILDNPLQGLIKYIATSGNAKGTLPEVTGQTPEEIKASNEYGKMKNKNALEYVARGDEINQEILPFGRTYAEAPDPEKIRSDFEDYITQIADWKNNARELQKDQAAFVSNAKDEMRLNQLSKTSAERQAFDEKNEHFLAKRRVMFEEHQAKVNAEAAKAQDRRNKLAEEFTKETKPTKFSTINPLKSQDSEVQKIWQKFNAKMNEAKNVGLKYVGKIPEIDAMGTKAFDLYESGYLPQEKQIKDILDNFFQYAAENGFEDLHYLPQYLPHVYENPDMFESAVQKSLKEKGLTQAEIQRYLNGQKLNPDLTTKLKLNPFFSKERFFPSYAEAAAYGLKPKFSKMSQLIEYYERQLLQTSAARGLIEDLSDSGKIEPEQTAPREWRHIKYGPEGLRGYTAPPILAQFLDNFFQGHADLGTLDRAVGNIAKIARFTQRLALSTGIPFTSIDPFAMGISIKEATRGNFKVLSSLVKSNSNDATIKSLQSDYKYIEMMARNGIDLRNLAGTIPENYETIKTKWGKLTEGVKKDPVKLSSYSPFFQIVGQGITNVFGKKTFNNFIPLLNVQVFKGAYEAAMKGGLSDADAQKLASDQTKSVMGLMDNVGRSKITNDYMSATFFAPVYREAMVNVLLNTAKSADPRSWKNPMYRFNRQLFAGMAIAFAAYALLNKKLNGYYMWDNPTGHGGDLRIPLPNGSIVYVPFMPSFMTIPRLIFAGTEAAIQGDVAGAFHQYGGVLSEVVSTTLDVLTNENYYDEPIYKTTDTPEQKFGKITAYLGGEVTSPYVEALITKIENAKGPTPTPLYESLVNALQLPIKFSTENKEQTNDIFNAIAAQAAATAGNSTEAKSEAASLTQLAKTSGNAAAAAQYDALAKSNPTLAKSVATILQAANAGKTSTDTELLELDVTNGDRAKFIYSEAMKLPPAQRNAYIDDLIKKKVVTSKVYAQIAYLIQNNGKP